MSDYPRVIEYTSGENPSPLEMEIVEKVTGVPFNETTEQLSFVEQTRVANMLALLRHYPDDDPGELWEAARRVHIREVPPNPTDAGASGP